MANSTTEQQQNSKDKKAYTGDEGINTLEWLEFMDREDEGRSRKIRIMETVYERAKEGDPRMLKLIMDKLISDAKKGVDITSGGDRIQTVLLDIFKDDPKKDE